jgi:hypothetical protein
MVFCLLNSFDINFFLANNHYLKNNFIFLHFCYSIAKVFRNNLFLNDFIKVFLRITEWIFNYSNNIAKN